MRLTAFRAIRKNGEFEMLAELGTSDGVSAVPPGIPKGEVVGTAGAHDVKFYRCIVRVVSRGDDLRDTRKMRRQQ
jgi:hypothetical protein